MAADAADAASAGADIVAVLRFVAGSSPLPSPGAGHTLRRWDRLARVAAADLTAARVLEAHADAAAILAEAGAGAPVGVWGVFAAEAPDATLRVEGTDTSPVLSGTKEWCSLAGSLDGALVTAGPPGRSRLYAVDLRHPGVAAAPAEKWVSRGLSKVPSGPVHFDGVPARPVGEPGWYLTRPGFARGGMGVAACWWGGATALRSTLLRHRRHDPIGSFQLGDVDVNVHAAAATLRDAAAAVDAGTDDWLLALRVRAAVAATCERVLAATAHALGPGPLCFDEEHARRVADLEVYLRQSHAERDLASIGDRLR
jgi:hypothetical protein